MRLDARFHSRSNGGRLEIVNHGPEPVYDLDVETKEVADGVRRSGARPVPSSMLVRRLGRS